VQRRARPGVTVVAAIADPRRRFGVRDRKPTTEMTMTGERVALIGLVEKKADGNLVREMLVFVGLFLVIQTFVVLQVFGALAEPLARWRVCIALQKLVKLLLPRADPWHRLMVPLIGEVGLVRPQDLPHCSARPRTSGGARLTPGHMQIPHDPLHRPALHVKGPTDPRDRIHPLHPPSVRCPATDGLTDHQRGQKCTQKHIQIPFRPDHGHVIGLDHGVPTHPGYLLTGRLRGLAELRGASPDSPKPRQRRDGDGPALLSVDR
jgi:hypothetical protein